MRKTAFRASVFALMIITMVMINMYVFRSELPMYWFMTLAGSVIALLLFPYKTFFNIKQN